MEFATWFKRHYRGPKEAKYPAIHRLALETGVAWTTVLRALTGSRLRPRTAQVLSRATHGMVSTKSLIFRPEAKELRQMRRDGGEPSAAAQLMGRHRNASVPGR